MKLIQSTNDEITFLTLIHFEVFEYSIKDYHPIMQLPAKIRMNYNWHDS